MWGNFSRLNRQSGGQKLEVEGWLVWETGDKSADLVVTVTQGAVSGTAPKVTVTPDDTTWKVTITSNGTPFIEGVASGLAGASVQAASGTVDSSWNSGPLQVH